MQNHLWRESAILSSEITRKVLHNQIFFLFINHAKIKEHLNDVCSRLVCRLSPMDINCNNITTIAAVNGTPCGRNSVCSNGQCVSSQASGRMNQKANNSIVDDCLFGDEIIKNQRIIDRQMRYVISQLSCEEYMNLDELRSPVDYCSNEIFRKTCCQTCKGFYLFFFLFIFFFKLI